MEKKNIELKTTLVELDARVSYSCVSSNTVKIDIKREKSDHLRRCQDGKLVLIESTKATPFPIPHLVLNNISSFEPDNIYRLLHSTFQDFMLSDSLTQKIVNQAKGASSGKGPICISIDVTLTLQTISGDFTSEMETCAICLEEARDLCSMSCSHTFHNDCIYVWLSESNTYPICRTIIENDDDDHS